MAQRLSIRQAWHESTLALLIGKFLAGAGTVAVAALALVFWFDRRPWPETTPEFPSLANAYAALEHGKAQEAEALFRPLLSQASSGLQSQGYAGLAAAAYVRNDYAQTLDFVRQAEHLDPESVYSHVLRGHVLLHQGKTAEAAEAYRTATDKTHGLPWQKAAAYNRLGRIAAAGGQLQQALAHYDKALTQPHSSPQEQVLTYTNKGHVLEKLGQYREALAQYRQAQALQPENRFTGTLLREAERRTQLTQDQEQQERLDKLVAELLQLHREQRQAPDRGDGWTSPRLTLALLPLHVQGAIAVRAGEEDVMLLRLLDALQTTGRLAVVERVLLDKVLAEMKLSAVELVEQQTAVRLGHILAARLLITGTLTRLGTEAQLSLRVVETESTRLKAMVTEIVPLPIEIDRLVEQLSSTLLAKLRTAYPLQGRIVQVASDGVWLNLGGEHGMTPGVKLAVFGTEAALSLDGKVVGYNRSRVGLLEVLHVQDRLAQARVVEQTVPFVEGEKVREVQGP